jgi:predicted nucleic acid-binding protein
VRVAIDTNVLAYAEGINGAERRDVALNLIRGLPQEAAVVPVQVLGELFNVLTHKGGKSRNDARDVLLSWRDTFPVVETSPEVMLAAADLATDHQLVHRFHETNLLQGDSIRGAGFPDAVASHPIRETGGCDGGNSEGGRTTHWGEGVGQASIDRPVADRVIEPRGARPDRAALSG